ncbi:hypothetical protein [Microbulbifer epialgicus]|uniref:Uncharacterized protein n=1 Tax=Microbulbifer epialgicus TaxID=393907 RepID=A0ABV4P5E1_9GAMM
MPPKTVSPFQISLQRRIIKRILGSLPKNDLSRERFKTLVSKSFPVGEVEDMYSESSDKAYLVISIDPCSPLIREVPKSFPGAIPTLAAAKKEARAIIQKAIAEAEQSLADVRQVGIEKINHLKL